MNVEDFCKQECIRQHADTDEDNWNMLVAFGFAQGIAEIWSSLSTRTGRVILFVGRSTITDLAISASVGLTWRPMVELWGRTTLTIIEKASRPYYKNTERTEPANGDIVRTSGGIVLHRYLGDWKNLSNTATYNVIMSTGHTEAVLLVDGVTGEAVTQSN